MVRSVHLPIAVTISLLAIGSGAHLRAVEGPLWVIPATTLNGDTNGNGEIDISDPLYLFRHLYLGGPSPVGLGCGSDASAWENGDVNADGDRDLSDGVALLSHLFLGGPAPVAACDLDSALELAVEMGPSGGNLGALVIPPAGRLLDRLYGVLGAQWWRWVFEIPASVNPILDTDGRRCRSGQSGPVFFLAGAGTTDPIHRTCAVPRGRLVFLPIINVECSTVEPDPFFGSNRRELEACADTFLSDQDPLTCTIDGQPVKNLQRFRVASPVFNFSMPAEDNILFLPGVTGGRSVADGYWILLAPLSRGSHQIHFTGTFATGPNAGFSQDVSYHLTAE